MNPLIPYNSQRMYWSHPRRVLVLALACTGLVSCEQRPLRVGYTPWPANEPITYAETAGRLPGHIRLSPLSSTNDLLIAFGAGQLELVVLSATNTLRLAANHVPLAVIAVLNTSSGADGIVARADVTSATAAGLVIATSHHDDNLFMLFRLAGNMNPASVFQLRHVDTDQRALEAFTRGEAEIACLSDPRLLALEDAGAHLLKSSRDFPDELAALLVVRRDTAESRRREIVRFLAFWYRWVAQTKSSPELVASIAREEDLTPQIARRLLDRISFPNASGALALLRDPAPQWYVVTRQYLATAGVTTVPPVQDLVLPDLLADACESTQ